MEIICWLWCHLWKLKVPNKMRLFMWCILSNKVPIELNLMKQDFQGPSRCCLCLSNLEDIDHLFLHCSIIAQVWTSITNSLNLKKKWEGQNVDEEWLRWWSEAPSQKARNLPLIVC